MKRILSVCIAVAMLASVAAGCTRTGTPLVTPSPVVTNPVASPTAMPAQTDGQTTTPGQIDGGATTPGNIDGQTTTPGTAGGTGTAGNAGGAGTMHSIPNFKEGTEVMVSDVPDIKSAIQKQYTGSSISKIAHGMYNNEQAYVVNYTDNAGKTGVVYVHPNGTILSMDGMNNVKTP